MLRLTRCRFGAGEGRQHFLQQFHALEELIVLERCDGVTTNLLTPFLETRPPSLRYLRVYIWKDNDDDAMQGLCNALQGVQLDAVWCEIDSEAVLAALLRRLSPTSPVRRFTVLANHPRIWGAQSLPPVLEFLRHSPRISSGIVVHMPDQTILHEYPILFYQAFNGKARLLLQHPNAVPLGLWPRVLEKPWGKERDPGAWLSQIKTAVRYAVLCGITSLLPHPRQRRRGLVRDRDDDDGHG